MRRGRTANSRGIIESVNSEADAAPGLDSLGKEIERLASASLEGRAGAGAALEATALEGDPFERAAVLRNNAMGIIFDGDGSSDAERIGRLVALVPALLNVVDEARDTISRLREIAGEQDPAKATSPWDAAGRGEPPRPDWDGRQADPHCQ
ncbi:MAG: hypothetical protein KF742_00475 [Cryobacterium sp.]|nr:hypothetical protein [Cryobacterium sp.]